MFSPTIPRGKKETNRIPKSEISISMSPSFKISSYMLRVLTRRRLQSWIQEMDTCTSRGDVVTMEALLRCHGPTWNHLRPLIRERVYGMYSNTHARTHTHSNTTLEHRYKHVCERTCKSEISLLLQLFPALCSTVRFGKGS